MLECTSEIEIDDEIAYFTVRLKTRASFVYRRWRMKGKEKLCIIGIQVVI